MNASVRWGSFGALMLLALIAWMTNRSTPLWMMFLTGGLVFLGVSYIPFGRMAGHAPLQGHHQAGAGIRPGFSRVLSWIRGEIRSLYNEVTSNGALTAAIICGMVFIALAILAISLQSTKFAQAAVLVSILAVEAIILCLAGGDHFKRNWKRHWFGLSLAGAAFSLIFRFGWEVTGIFLLSAFIAGVEATGTRKEVLGFFGKVISFLVRHTVRFLVWAVTGSMRILSRLLSTEFGWDVALFTAAVLSFIGGFALLSAGLSWGITGLSLSVPLCIAGVVVCLVTRVK